MTAPESPLSSLSPQELSLPVRQRGALPLRSPVVEELAETFRHVYPTPVGMEFFEGQDDAGRPIPVPMDRCIQIMRSLDLLHKSVQWWIGDLLLYAEHRHGEMYAQAAELTGYTVGYLKNIVVTCRAIPQARRHPDLSFSHHIQVANRGLSHNAQTIILDRAAREGYDRDQTRTLAQQILSQANKLMRKPDEPSAVVLPVRRLPVEVSERGAYQFITKNLDWEETYCLAQNLLDWANNRGVVDDPYSAAGGPYKGTATALEPPGAIVIGRGAKGEE